MGSLKVELVESLSAELLNETGRSEVHSPFDETPFIAGILEAQTETEVPSSAFIKRTVDKNNTKKTRTISSMNIFFIPPRPILLRQCLLRVSKLAYALS
jgi:hypothetical protein